MIDLHPGENRVEGAIDLVGYEIPELERFLAVERYDSGRLSVQLRPLASGGGAVIDHPCLDIRVFLRVSVQLDGDAPAQATLEEGARRGNLLFAGPINWRWNASREATFRYEVFIPTDQFVASEASFWVIDYLILAPDPRTTSGTSLSRIMRDIEREKGLDEVLDYLAGLDSSVSYFTATSWNVRNPYLGGSQ